MIDAVLLPLFSFDLHYSQQIQGGVSEALVGVLLDGEPDTLLDKYAEIRKSIFLKYNNKWYVIVLRKLFAHQSL